MCTQELIWCSCGHGEFLPIACCARGLATGLCWTVVHGNHRLVVPGPCSYCKAGLDAKRALESVRLEPGGVVAGKGGQGKALRREMEEGLGSVLGGEGGGGEGGVSRSDEGAAWDVLEQDSGEFDWERELWQCDAELK